jgi:hypothetical protein
MSPEQLYISMMMGFPEWGRVDPFSIKVNGNPLEFGSLYWVALSEQLHAFLLANDLIPVASMQTGLFEYNVVRDFMSARHFLDYRIEGRILDRNSSLALLSVAPGSERFLPNGPAVGRERVHIQEGKVR